MRIPPVLSTRDLPSAELQAGVLDGELVRVGEAYCAVDTIIGSRHRAESIATELPRWAIAEQHTAAWIYGVTDTQPTRLQLCVESHAKMRPISSPRHAFREVVLSEADTVAISVLSVTTPLRTALDLARMNTEFSKQTQDVVRGLASLGRGFTLADCAAAISMRRNLPFKRKALARLSSTLRGY